VNLLLVTPEEVGPDGRVRLEGRRAKHLLRVLGVTEGKVLRAGVVGRGLGTARVVAVETRAVEVVVEGVGEGVGPASDQASDQAPDRVAAGPPVNLILALPRPKALRRILRLTAAMGVRRLTLINAWRVEKSYFQSPLLEPEAIHKELLLGAEQGGTARLPEVGLERFFVPFVSGLETEEDKRPRILAHPGAPLIEVASGEQVTGAQASGEEGGGTGLEAGCLLAIGPEGGWIEPELESFDRAGFRRASFGPWVLTTEAAVAVALGQVAVVSRRVRAGSAASSSNSYS